ncbi:MAG: Dam family site-specific DNA-(adenine-N6)-methyltransferase [Helicobacter sp.]|nr:Dam family site-specific DNA-(adenine-N6)-methyltransferase [Helicobacter sp.]MDE5816429.1 Dam family site-specific DNA-(adenine-N6)-methyltransferase [Helicobacter sp.]
MKQFQYIQTNKTIRSPFFYVGDKYKLMPQLKRYFPKHIETYIEPFVGGGSSFLNIQAQNYILNDANSYIISLHKFLQDNAQNPHFIMQLFSVIESYQLSCSLKNIIPPKELREAYKKTYFAKYNKESYLKLRHEFNANKNDMLKLYILLIYGFNRMIRFNSKGNFNLPVGNVDFNINVLNALKDYFAFMDKKKLTFFNLDYREFLTSIPLKQTDFIYLDPPYLISGSEYNKLWDEHLETSLYILLNNLDSQGIRWGLSNLLRHKGKINVFLEKFTEKYQTYIIKSNYISFNDNSIKKDSLEVYVTNAQQKA